MNKSSHLQNKNYNYSVVILTLGEHASLPLIHSDVIKMHTN